MDFENTLLILYLKTVDKKINDLKITCGETNVNIICKTWQFHIT